MPILDETHRAPAYGPLRTALARLCKLLTICSHSHPTHPVRGVQSCLDCGSSRTYIETPTGFEPGQWHRASRPASTARKATAELNNEGRIPCDLDELDRRIFTSLTPGLFLHNPAPEATEIRKHRWPERCRDCGLLLDQFGSCPAATAVDMATMRAPVYCGRMVEHRCQASPCTANFSEIESITNAAYDRLVVGS